MAIYVIYSLLDTICTPWHHHQSNLCKSISVNETLTQAVCFHYACRTCVLDCTKHMLLVIFIRQVYEVCVSVIELCIQRHLIHKVEKGLFLYESREAQLLDNDLGNMTAGRNDRPLLFPHPYTQRSEYPAATTALYDRENEETSRGNEKERDEVKAWVQETYMWNITAMEREKDKQDEVFRIEADFTLFGVLPWSTQINVFKKHSNTWQWDLHMQCLLFIRKCKKLSGFNSSLWGHVLLRYLWPACI